MQGKRKNKLKRKKIDLLIINNCPSFYKINLYNELYLHCKMHVIFIGLSKQVVIPEDIKNEIKFSYDLIFDGQIERRNKLKSFASILFIIRNYNFKKIIYGGFVELENRLLMLFISRKKNCIQSESSIIESKTKGIIGLLKKMLFKRFSIALTSGKLQSDVFRRLNFVGEIVETKGVGIFNKYPHIVNIKRTRNLKYLYVGRIIALKNLELLVQVFNENGKSLTIAGTGEMEAYLKTKALPNIKFTGFVPNSNIYKLYNTHDVFILPSLVEPWGLVVEEAIYYGMPVLISKAVGCQFDMVEIPKTGLTFSPTSKIDIQNKIKEMEMNIDIYRENILKVDFDKRDIQQVEAYLNIISL